MQLTTSALISVLLPMPLAPRKHTGTSVEKTFSRDSRRAHSVSALSIRFGQRFRASCEQPFDTSLPRMISIHTYPRTNEAPLPPFIRLAYCPDRFPILRCIPLCMLRRSFYYSCCLDGVYIHFNLVFQSYFGERYRLARMWLVMLAVSSGPTA
jgi:hypothetical protein